MRMIDGDALEKALEDTIVPHRLIAIIRRQPTIEPKRGRWIKKDGDFWECSECGQRIFSMSKQDREEFHRWCGRCGAKMDDTPTEKVDTPTENTNRPTDEVEE